MKKLIALTKQVVPAAVIGLTPFVASAAPIVAPQQLTKVPSSIVPDQNIQSLQDVLQSVCVVFGWLFVFLIAFAIVFGVLAAYGYLTSSGEPEKVKQAGNRLLYAAIAVGVALLARAIPLIVANFLTGGFFFSIGSC